MAVSRIAASAWVTGIVTFFTVFVAANATTAQQLAVNAQLTKLVDDDGNAAALRVGEQLAQEGGFTAA